MLLQNSLVPGCLLLLRVNVVNALIVLDISKNHIFLLLAELGLLNFGHFSFCLLLKLPGEGHEQVVPPNVELSLCWGRDLLAEERTLVVWQLLEFLQLPLHIIHDKLFLLGVH